jgi:membrane associated rhomboid family serine protease
MAELIEFALWGLITVTTCISWQGFRNGLYFDKYTFDVDKIRIDRQYYRLFSAGFLHKNWTHLIFNMASLYVFSSGVGYTLGVANFMTIYISSKLLSSLLALYIHRHHGDYTSVGASGAVSGIIFSYIAMFPTSNISFFFIPYEFPAWAFGVFFMLVSIFGIKRQADNIGHEAHLGGALAGVLLTILLEPMILKTNYLTIFAITIPAFIFLLLIIYKPSALLVESYWGVDEKAKSRLPQKDYDVLDDETALNELLEKVSEKGYHNLSKQEKKKLEELSRKIES